MPGTTERDDAWWLAPAAPEAGRGLSAAEAAARLARDGPNTFVDRRQRPLGLRFVLKLRNPLVLVLLVASLVTGITGDFTGSLIIVAMVLLSVGIDFVQEVRAGNIAEGLRASIAPRARVLRDGHEAVIPAAEVVAGDVLLLAAGDLIAADARVLVARDCFVQQSMLTGESFPAEKHAQPATESGIDAATNAVFMGTSVLSGSARAVVERTGARTAIGALAGTLAREPPPTAFDLGMRRFGALIMRLTLLLALLVLLANLLLGRPWPTAFLFAIALAVGLAPELLPMVISVTLAVGARRLSQQQVIVRRLAAIQDLGSMDVLCTDKTGTLTEAKIRLERHVGADGADSARVLLLASLNSRFETGLRNPLDDAILAHEEVDTSGWTKVDEVPFDFERRRVSVLVDDGRARQLVVKGAAEEIVALCAAVEWPADGPEGAPPGAARPLDAATRARLLALHDSLADEGFRVLGIARKTVPRDRASAETGDEADLVFAGFCAFLDPARTDAADALRLLAARGVAVKIVTGDNERVTQHLCRALGLPVAGVLTGSAVEALDDAALAARAPQATLFCRMNPVQKSRVILALKRAGHVVGYLGDGVNDAPPLHAADVGISVDNAVDVARAAADMILLRHDLAVLAAGVLEGRRTFANITKYVLMGTSSNFGNMASMAVASVLLPFLPMLPAQILLNNMLYDISEIAIPLDRVDDSDLARPRSWDMRFIRDFMWVVGPVSSLFDFLTFGLLLWWFRADAALFQTGWFVESLATQVLVIFVIRTRFAPWASRAHPLLVATSIGVVLCAALLPLTPLGGWLGFVPPPPAFYASIGAMTVVYLLLVESVKRAFYRRHRAAPAVPPGAASSASGQ